MDGSPPPACLPTACRRMGGQVTPLHPRPFGGGVWPQPEAIHTLADQGDPSLSRWTAASLPWRRWPLPPDSGGWTWWLRTTTSAKTRCPPRSAWWIPHRSDCPYPFKGLAGVGVALKLAMAVAGPERARQVFEDYADLAAVGTVADVMPMTGRTAPSFRPDWPLWPTPSGWAWPNSSRRLGWGSGLSPRCPSAILWLPASTLPDAWARRLWPRNCC